MTTLHGNLFRQNLLDVLHDCEAQGRDGQARGSTQQWGVQGVAPEAVFTQHLVLPRPEQIYAQEGKACDDRNQQPDGYVGGGTLFSWVAFNREALLTECNGYVVELGAGAASSSLLILSSSASV